MPLKIELVDAPNDGRLRFINDQPFLTSSAITESFGFNGLIAKWGARAIEVAAAGVLTHRPRSVLRVFLALVLVERRKHTACQDAGRILTRLLADCDYSRADLGQT